jgi:glycosyltransferase involved in cell wall biosynthesis
MINKSNALWITWEDHRRSRELAGAFNAEYVPILQKGNRYFRYPILTVKTITLLLARKPKTVFCQNPSIVLNSLLCVLKFIFRFYLISDRHSNFKPQTKKSWNPKWILFHALSKFTIKQSDLVIVTNEFLKNYIIESGGKSEILEDKIPDLHPSKKIPLSGAVNIVFVSTFSYDEPIEEVIEAAQLLPNDYHIHITGNYKKYINLKHIQEIKPNNVNLTGFLSEVDYLNILSSADIIMVITDQEHTLTCGAYEAVALGKPMVLGNTETIKNYFSKGAAYTPITPGDISSNILICANNKESLKNETVALSDILHKNWTQRFAHIKAIIDKVN